MNLRAIDGRIAAQITPEVLCNAVAKLDQNRQLGLTRYPKTVAETYTLLSQ
jgi:hypothetical protein